MKKKNRWLNCQKRTIAFKETQLGALIISTAEQKVKGKLKVQ